MSAIVSLSPQELAARVAAGEDLVLLDVREPEEWKIARIEGSRSIPMSALAARVSELDPERPTVCICHHGIRSAHVAGRLAELGFRELYNLAGGIERWSLEIDPGVRRY
jgi:rhodanese-related sulfurtransferase